MSPDKSTLDELRIDRSSPARKNSHAWILAVVAVACAVGIVGWLVNRSKPVPVRTLTVRQPVAEAGGKTVLNASGYVVARREATVSSKVTGKVIEVFVEEGVQVTAGKILARLDAANVETSLQLAQAQFEASKSSLNEITVRLDEAERELRRTTDLANQKIASPADLDHAQAEAKSLKARLQRQQVEIAVAEKQIALWQQQMDDTVIRAPFAGIVTSKNAQPGEMISPISAGGGFTRTGICTIVDMDSLEIEVDVNESYINRVEPGQPVEATLDAYLDWKIPCKVIAIVPTADRQKATVKVRVGFVKLDPRILPQMGVKVAFRTGAEAPSIAAEITIPKSAVRQRDGSAMVFVARNGRVERRAITVGSARGDEIVVRSGLAPGDKVLLDKPEAVAEGDRVEDQK
jgi:HlyD family secretion protein